ncbi:uncharacterized protein LOC122538709 isoform X2 [Frieseomelitta varia]|uniref:uncharacterized protein LOC122538709 isoform X2 n=1 Tax=Frieseomelitta varia TaxID=561572 RepID=UPI001CB6B3BB|nr:uncharacterized protein LOC122538709 isoform X2 [Frieseomelitta varia]
MLSSYRAIILLLVVVTTHTHTPTENEPTCNCDHCNDEVVTVEAKEGNENTTVKLLYKEDSDGDGDRTICARDRDFNDRTFSSVCHMLCYNRCLILRLSTVTENDTKKYVAIAYRNNYYKLRDGEC